MAKVSFVANGKRVTFKARPSGTTPNAKLTPFARYVKAHGKAANKKASSPSAAMKAMAKAWKKK
jgi:hypothetical protein